ncbi:MAG: hypothetical protein JRG94_22210 [Deltaproteobacteria bacterium]|nr:hypothetical protein [Deltaproteobacteria bacterium]
MTQIVREVAEATCNGRIAFVLEGGYSAQGLAEGTAGVLSGMLEPAGDPLSKQPVDVPVGSNLEQIVNTVSQVHHQTFACIAEP